MLYRNAILVGVLLMGGAAYADSAPALLDPALPEYVSRALADPSRPAADLAIDDARKPGELIVFAGVKPGDKVVELVPEHGYSLRILSGVVGARGHVYMFVQTELNDRPARPGGAPGPGKAMELASSIAADYAANVSVLLRPTNEFSAPMKLDVAWMTLNYHDLHTPTFAEADVAKFNGAVYAALKPGGVFFVVDHSAEPGSGLRDTRALHRIDPAIVKNEIEAAGFVLESESDMLRNPADDHTRKVFDPSIRNHTDRFILKFRKPRA